MPEAHYTLVAVETASIQSYIFGSNRLRENVGASYLVAAATGEWAIDIARDLNDKKPLEDAITDDALQQVEMIYSGGGNIVLLFREESTATEFIRTLSRQVLREAPGLQLTFNRALFDWSGALSQAVGELISGMKAQRAQQPALTGRAGMGVNIMGVSTTLPAGGLFTTG